MPSESATKQRNLKSFRFNPDRKNSVPDGRAMRRNGAKSWLDFWNGDTAIYACDRHRELHYEGVARDLSAHVPSPDSLVLDYGCGEALFAARLARECSRLLLYHAAPLVRGRLRARFANEARIEILEDGTLGEVSTPRSISSSPIR